MSFWEFLSAGHGTLPNSLRLLCHWSELCLQEEPEDVGQLTLSLTSAFAIKCNFFLSKTIYDSVMHKLFQVLVAFLLFSASFYWINIFCKLIFTVWRRLSHLLIYLLGIKECHLLIFWGVKSFLWLTHQLISEYVLLFVQPG